MKIINIDDEMFYNGSLASLIEAVTIDKTKEYQQLPTDAEDNFDKVELYQRKTTNEER